MEYAKITNNQHVLPHEAQVESDKSDYEKMNSWARLVVKIFIQVLAEKLEVGDDLVWNALKRHYFTGGFDEETKWMIHDLFGGKDFLEKLATLKSDSASYFILMHFREKRDDDYRKLADKINARWQQEIG